MDNFQESPLAQIGLPLLLGFGAATGPAGSRAAQTIAGTFGTLEASRRNREILNIQQQRLNLATQAASRPTLFFNQQTGQLVRVPVGGGAPQVTQVGPEPPRVSEILKTLGVEPGAQPTPATPTPPPQQARGTQFATPSRLPIPTTAVSQVTQTGQPKIPSQTLPQAPQPTARARPAQAEIRGQRIQKLEAAAIALSGSPRPQDRSLAQQLRQQANKLREQQQKEVERGLPSQQVRDRLLAQGIDPAQATPEEIGDVQTQLSQEDRPEFRVKLDVFAQQRGVNSFNDLSPDDRLEVLKEVRTFEQESDISRIVQEEITKATLKVSLPRQISEDKVTEFAGRVNLIGRMDNALDQFKGAFNIQSTDLSDGFRRELVKLGDLTQITKFVPLDVTQALTDEERRFVSAMNFLMVELRGIVREGRPSDFDAARAVRALSSTFLASPRTAFDQLLTTRDAIAQDLQRELATFQEAGFQFQLPEGQRPTLRRPEEEEAIPDIPPGKRVIE